MKNIATLALISGVLLLGGCARKNDSGKIAEANYQESLKDSIRKISMEIDSCRTVSASLSDKVNNLLRDFTAVNKSREVEGYTIFQGWDKRYPLRATGLVARINSSEQLELVATLTGGVFDKITVTSGAETAVTGVVPNDQALNYRQEGLTTVMFTGEGADSVARLIADNELNPIKVTYVNGGTPTGTWRMAGENAKMISMTYLLYNSHKEQTMLERKANMLSEKIKILRSHQKEN